MRYGVILDTRGPNASSESLIAGAVLAERLGYDAVWSTDHVVVPVRFDAEYPYQQASSYTLTGRENAFETLATLAYVAGCTSAVRLGTSVIIAPQRNPVLTGKQLATLDALSGGRLVVGVGIGWMAEEFAALGAGAAFAKRGAVTDEHIQIWKALWTDETSSFAGDHCSVPPVRAFPKPVQRPHPPILVGGNSPAARRRAVRLGDGWHAVHLTAAQLEAGIAELHELARAAGRAPETLRVSAQLNVRLGAPDAQPHELAGADDAVRAHVAALERLGVSELALDFTTGSRAPQDLAGMERFAALVGLRPRG